MPSTPSRATRAGGNHCKKAQTHTTPQAGGGVDYRKQTRTQPTTTPYHRWEPLGGGGGGGPAEPGSFVHALLALGYSRQAPRQAAQPRQLNWAHESRICEGVHCLLSLGCSTLAAPTQSASFAVMCIVPEAEVLMWLSRDHKAHPSSKSILATKMLYY